jgi:murein L,D-transpeptidase YafK
LAVQARNCGQVKIEVHIFPFEMSEKKLEARKYDNNYIFWKSIQPGFLHFENERDLPKVEINENGKYYFK